MMKPYIRAFVFLASLSSVLPAASYAETPLMGEATLIVRQGERLNLNRCIEIAQKMQPNIAFAVNTVYATRARVSQAQSGYYPQVDASAGWSRSDPAAEVGAGSSKSSGLYTGSVNLKQNIYDFGRTSGQVNAERYNLESSRSDLENTRNQTAFNVKAAYYGALLAGKNRDVSQEAVKQFEEHLLQAKGFYEVGTKPKIDVTRAEVDLSGAKVGLIKAENSLRIAKINLRNAMGIPEAPLFDIEDDLTFQGFDIGLEEAVSRAFSSRPDLKSLIERKKSSEENVELAKKSYYPVLSGSAAYNWAGESFPLERGWNLGAVVTMPVFSGFLTKYQVEESRANLNAVNANLELLRQNVILDVQQAWFNLKEALERVPAAELALRQAAENLELANARYATGVGSPIEITDASAAYINAKLTHFQSLSDYKVAEANLEKAMGKR